LPKLVLMYSSYRKLNSFKGVEMSENNEEYDIFVSYDELTGREYAEIIHKALKRRGYKVFVAHLERVERTGKYRGYIDRIILNCTTFILVNTYDALNRDEVIREFNQGFPNGDLTTRNLWIFKKNEEIVPYYTTKFNENTNVSISDQNQIPFGSTTELATHVLSNCDQKNFERIEIAEPIKKKPSLSENQRKDYSELLQEKKNYDDGSSFYVNWRAYTTNYDVLFEKFWADYEDLNDFFTKQDSSARYFFDLNAKVRELSIIKLHGSLSWSKYTDERIVKATEFTHRELTKKGIVILPNQQKDLYMHPWITLFQNLKDGLHNCNVWIVIGYSFNDEFILNVFREAFNEHKLLILISPHAEKLLSKFPKNRHKQITVLPIKFGDQNFPLQFTDFLENKKTLSLYVKTKSNIIGVKSSTPTSSFEIIPMENVGVGNLINNPTENESMYELHNPKNNEIELKLILPFLPPFDQNFTLQFITNKPRLSYEIFYGNKCLERKINQIPKLDASKNHYYTKPIKIAPSSLFIN